MWGTGSASREFLYVDDAAEASSSPPRSTTVRSRSTWAWGEEITIRELVELIAEVTGFTGEIRWDASKPDGQPRRALDTKPCARAVRVRGTDLIPRWSFADGRDLSSRPETRGCGPEGHSGFRMTTSNLSVRLHARLVGLRRSRRILRLTPFETATAEGRSNERFRRASLSAATSAAAKGIALVTTAVSVPLTLGYLGSERFGIWMTLSALIALLGFTDLGIGNSLLNGVAHAAGREDRTLIRANVSSGVAMLLAVSAGFGLLFAAVYRFIPWDRVFNVGSAGALDEAGPAAVALVGCFLVAMPAGAFQQVRLGLQEGYINAIFVAVGNIGGLALVIWAIQMRLGLPWLVLAMAGAPLLATLVNGFALVARSPWLRPTLHDVNFAVARSLLRVGLLFLVLQLAFAVAFTSNSIIIAAMIRALGGRGLRGGFQALHDSHAPGRFRARSALARIPRGAQPG